MISVISKAYIFVLTLSSVRRQDCLRAFQEQIEESIRNNLAESSPLQKASSSEHEAAAAVVQPTTPTDVRDIVLVG